MDMVANENYWREGEPATPNLVLRFVGDQTGLSPILSLVGIYVGMKVAGVAGMILGPILILVVLNLVGLGIFQGFWMDVTAAARDITAILSQRPERK